MAGVAQSLEQGVILIIDYGHETAELYRPRTIAAWSRTGSMWSGTIRSMPSGARTSPHTWTSGSCVVPRSPTSSCRPSTPRRRASSPSAASGSLLTGSSAATRRPAADLSRRSGRGPRHARPTEAQLGGCGCSSSRGPPRVGMRFETDRSRLARLPERLPPGDPRGRSGAARPTGGDLLHRPAPRRAGGRAPPPSRCSTPMPQGRRGGAHGTAGGLPSSRPGEPSRRSGDRGTASPPAPRWEAAEEVGLDAGRRRSSWVRSTWWTSGCRVPPRQGRGARRTRTGPRAPPGEVAAILVPPVDIFLPNAPMSPPSRGIERLWHPLRGISVRGPPLLGHRSHASLAQLGAVLGGRDEPPAAGVHPPLDPLATPPLVPESAPPRRTGDAALGGARAGASDPELPPRTGRSLGRRPGLARYVLDHPSVVRAGGWWTSRRARGCAPSRRCSQARRVLAIDIDPWRGRGRAQRVRERGPHPVQRGGPAR